MCWSSHALGRGWGITRVEHAESWPLLAASQKQQPWVCRAQTLPRVLIGNTKMLDFDGAAKEVMPHKTPKSLKVTGVLSDLFAWSLCLVSSKAEITCLRSLGWSEVWDPSTVLDKICGSIYNCICWFYLFTFSRSPVFNERFVLLGFLFFWDKISDLSETKEQVLVKWVHSSPSELGSRLRDYWNCFHSFTLEHSHRIFNLWACFLSSAGIAVVCNDFFSFGAKVKHEFMMWLRWDFRTVLQKSKLLWSYLPGDYRQITLAKHPIPEMIYWAPEYFY